MRYVENGFEAREVLGSRVVTAVLAHPLRVSLFQVVLADMDLGG